MRHLELFAGIGGFRMALTKLSEDFGIPQKTVAFSEIDKNASASYKANYDTTGEQEMGDIVAFNSVPGNIRRLPDFDLLSGGFPCQSFSMMGKQLGFSDSRGNLFFEIMKILHEKRPRFVLLENVRNLVNHDGGNTFKTIKAYLESEGYHVYHDVFDTQNFGLAQVRKRVYIFASLIDLGQDFVYSAERIQTVFEGVLEKTSLLKQRDTFDVLDKQVDEKYYLSERIKPTILANGSKSYRAKSEINPLIARPLTATMVKMHRACQDNYFSDEYISSTDHVKYLEKEYTKEEQSKKRIRKITPWEALELQGFPREFYCNAEKAGISNHQLYKQAGNAVSVNTVYAILYYIFIHCHLLEE